MKTRFTFFSVLAVLFTAALAPVDAAKAVDIIKGPYLQQVTQDSIVIMWETDVASGGQVDYGAGVVVGDNGVSIHEILIIGLSSNTLYNYTVTSDDASDSGTFYTAPSAGQPFRFVAYGNTRTNISAHEAVIQAIITSAPDLVINTGDLVTNGNNYTLWGLEFFGPGYDLMINTPLLPILGNHEYEDGKTLFFDFFSLPGNESLPGYEQWFAFTYGCVRFIGLNTNVSYSPGSDQYIWLVGELQSDAYTSATWHIVYFHHPPYTCTSGHSDDTDVQQDLVPLFEDNGVDMVFNGHSHVYERYSHNGIYYIVTGGGGASLHSLLVDNKEPIRQVGVSTYHHCDIYVDVPNESLTMSARYNSGTAFDTITITKTAKASNPNPEHGAKNVPVDTVLSWRAGIGAVSHDVYFGTEDPPPFIQNQDGTSYYPETLAPGITYYWAVDEHNSSGITYGDIWRFTTEVSLPWSDGFESGSFAAGGWTTSGNASVSSKADYSGIYGAEIKGTAWIEKAVSTVGFININIKCVCKTKGLDDGEYLYVEWHDGSDGSPWNLLKYIQSTDWSLQNFTCETGANDNADFKVRFRTNGSNSAEYAYVDDVEITSEPVHDHDVAVMAITAPVSVVAGETATINVTVENQGTFKETFDVTLTLPEGGTAGTVTDSPQTIIALVPGDSVTVIFSWDTDGATLGDHTLEATAGPVTDETDTADNSMSTTSTVAEAGATIHVESINMSLLQTGKNWKAVAKIIISPTQAGATVVGDWYLNGSVIQTGATGVTDGSGCTEITLPPKKAKSLQIFRFVVTDVVLSGYDYDPGQGVTEASITVP